MRQALAARRAADILVMTKLDRLARSVPHARAFADELAARSIKPDLGGVKGSRKFGRVPWAVLPQPSTHNSWGTTSLARIITK